MGALAEVEAENIKQMVQLMMTKNIGFALIISIQESFQTYCSYQ